MAFFNPDMEDPYGGGMGAMAPEPDDPYQPPPPPPPGGGSGGGSPTPSGGADFWHPPAGFFQYDSYEGPSGNFAIPDAPQFQAPTLADAQASPGYRFRSLEGQKALERSAAARGLLRTGGTLKDINDYGQNFASQEYGNVFNRSLEGYDRSLRAYGTQTGFERDRALSTARNMLDAWSTRFNAQRRAMELLASIGSNIYMNNQDDPGRNEPVP